MNVKRRKKFFDPSQKHKTIFKYSMDPAQAGILKPLWVARRRTKQAIMRARPGTTQLWRLLKVLRNVDSAILFIVERKSGMS